VRFYPIVCRKRKENADAIAPPAAPCAASTSDNRTWSKKSKPGASEVEKVSSSKQKAPAAVPTSGKKTAPPPPPPPLAAASGKKAARQRRPAAGLWHRRHIVSFCPVFGRHTRW
jgi:hypothetical protein